MRSAHFSASLSSEVNEGRVCTLQTLSTWFKYQKNEVRTKIDCRKIMPTHVTNLNPRIKAGLHGIIISWRPKYQQRFLMIIKLSAIGSSKNYFVDTFSTQTKDFTPSDTKGKVITMLGDVLKQSFVGVARPTPASHCDLGGPE